MKKNLPHELFQMAIFQDHKAIEEDRHFGTGVFLKKEIDFKIN